jgi:general secretion pathway protein F
MPVFEYKGINKQGRQTKGVLDADNPRTLKENLRKQGIFLSDYREAEEGIAKSTSKRGAGAGATRAPRRGRGKRVKVIELAELTRQIATLLKASIPVVDCLAAVGKQAENPRLQRILNEIRRAVTEGKSLAGAMADHPSVFNDLYVNMVRAGESSGTLDVVFFRLADFTESQSKLVSKVRGALTYPLVMMVVGVGIVSLMMVFVVPKLTAMFTDMGQKLPAITRGLIAVSDFFQNWWHLSFVSIIFLVWWFNRYRKSEGGKPRIDRITLKIPVLGPMLRMVAVARFSRTLGTLLNSGVPIVSALEIVKHVVGNVVLSDVIEEAIEAVQQGDSLAKPLERSGQFPPMVCHMIAVGEQSGQVEEMLDNVSSAYELQVDSKLNVLTSLLEPLMILFMGVAVALIVFAILTPMLQMNELLKG